MPLTILRKDDVDALLHALTKEDIVELQQSLADALHWYSTSNDGNDCCSDYQPERTTVKRRDGTTTMFVPASGMSGQGISVVNMTPPGKDGLPTIEALMLNSSAASTTSSTNADSPRTSISGSSGAKASTPSSSNVSFARSESLSSDTTGKTSVDSQPTSGSAVETIRSSLTLMDTYGRTTGLINAEELIAFRTALASTILLEKRQSVHDLTVFGAGRQAYWHIRLAMLMRPEEIHHLNIITRNFDSARNCIMRLYNPRPQDPSYVNPIGTKYNSKTKTNILTPVHTEYSRLLKEFVRSANVIFCTTASETPLFPAEYLTNPEGRKKGRYIVCVGSIRPHMIELHPNVLRYAVAPHHEHRHVHKRQKEGGAVIVDTVSGCLREAGEIIQANLQPDQVVELGELFMLKREAAEQLRKSGKQVEGGCALQQNSGLREWLTKGNVIYKSIGLGLMDVTVGNDLVRLARTRNVGSTMEDF